jgi:alkyl hydroperoxide reductase subunit AhpC
LAEIEKNYDTYEKLNTRVFAVSTDSPGQSSNLVRKLGLSFTLLCDHDKKVIDLFDLRNPLEHDGIAHPATFIINPGGNICYRSLDGTAKRVDLTDELAFLEQLNKDSGHIRQAKPKKAWVIPSIKDNWRISMNMITKGNFSDWKNVALLPVNYSKILVSKIKRT